MTHYVALIDGEAGAYGAWVPDAPGCTAMGKAVDETVGNLVEALREWMADRVAAGLAPPVARSYEEVAADPASDREVAHTFAQVPLLLDSGRSVRANISLDAGLLEQIDEAAKLRGLTRSAFLASAAREKIAEQR